MNMSFASLLPSEREPSMVLGYICAGAWQLQVAPVKILRRLRLSSKSFRGECQAFFGPFGSLSSGPSQGFFLPGRRSILAVPKERPSFRELPM